MKSLVSLSAALIIAAIVVVAPSVSTAQRPEVLAKPFEGMAGSWTGSGIVTFGSGAKERLRCKVNYDVANDGNRVEQELRCASDSYKFEMNADINYNGGFISGRWNEFTRRQTGTISGRASAGLIEALAETGGFSAFFTMATRGNQQSVKIKSESHDISDVTITLTRAGR
jgi:hypothetical protein